MSTESTYPSVTGSWRSSGAARVREVGLDRAVIVQSLASIVPAMLAVAIGAPQAGAYYFFAAYLTFLGWSVLWGYQVRALALTVGVLPGLMLLRDLFLYNSVILVFGITVFGILLRSPRHARDVWRTGFLLIFYICALYWLVSYMITGDYSANLRLLELALSAAAFVLLMNHPIQLASALFSLMLSLIAWGCAFFPYGHRLGMAIIGGVTLGNPITFGLPLAFILTLLVADRGRYLLLQRSPWLRVVLCIVVGALLLLSTSRASWLVAAMGIAMVMVFNRNDRRIAMSGIGMLIVVGAILLHSQRGSDLTAGFQRTFSEDRSMRNRTSGRSDQWMLLPVVLHDKPILGFGPGTGKDVYAKYSLLVPSVRFNRGEHMRWHSLYLQVAVETGFVGIGILTILFIVFFRSNYRAWRATEEVAPLLGAMGFALLALTVSGMDAASGLFLGLGLSVIGRRALANELPRTLPTHPQPRAHGWSTGRRVATWKPDA